MDIHKPKPMHSLQEFLSEIAVVVCGILMPMSPSGHPKPGAP
jgi:hypothetical protein